MTKPGASLTCSTMFHFLPQRHEGFSLDYVEHKGHKEFSLVYAIELEHLIELDKTVMQKLPKKSS